uniref:CSON007353 protein n=1 Tax=Culicoides sonorensis TaxID=179676 RepID=A0A336KEV7_CULSO
MSFKMKHLIFLFIIFTLIKTTISQCNTCGPVSQAACISEDQYFPCVNNIPNFSQILRCPTGSVCANVAGVCDTVTLTPACTICGMCNALNGYACLSQTSYSPCSAGQSINWPINCPTGMICYPTGTNTDPCTSMTWMQVQRCPSGIEPPSVSSTTQVTPTTPKVYISPQSFCRVNNPGYYKNPNDVTCRTYFYCYWYFGMTGVVMGCNGNTIFNPTTRTCVTPTLGFSCSVV